MIEKIVIFKFKLIDEEWPKVRTTSENVCCSCLHLRGLTKLGC
jgi:hypothetical protein